MCKIYKDCNEIRKLFENEIKTVNIKQPNPLPEIERGMLISRNYINRLRELVYKACITSTDSEVYFFKCIKPLLVGYFLYFFYLQKIENGRPKGPVSVVRKYLEHKAEKFNSFLRTHREEYYYYKRDDIKHDQQIFVRCNITTRDYNYHPYSMLDNNFATSQDYLFADFKAHEMLIEYLCKEIDLLERPTMETVYDIPYPSPFKWTGSKIDLTELIYALASSDDINNGNVDIKMLSQYLQAIFNVTDLDIYRKFVDLKLRKKKPTIFLDKIKERLIQKIKDADE